MILNMADDVQKYRAITFQAAGFALMTPLARIVLELEYLRLNALGLQFFLYVFLALFLFFSGIILIARGMEVLEGKC